ncbi:pilin [Psychrobacter sp. 16-MNA-CIBAN-0192]|uniref:pilin n=1 Tax=Psychrobacter sp. 16-MNA-CIBAN-0192 TaxID=3140448 RepID=UPI003316BBD0
MLKTSKRHVSVTLQSGFTLIELMLTIAVIGILAAIAAVSYQSQIRQSQLTTIYQELNHFRLPYQILINEGAGVTGFSPEGLNVPEQTKYCQFTVTTPHATAATPNAVRCKIQNIGYLQNQHLSLDRAANGTWQCQASAGIPHSYLPKGCQ